MSALNDLPELAEFTALLEAADEPTAVALAVRVAASGPRGVWDVVDTLIPAAMTVVGSRWETARWTVAQEHVATDICLRIVEKMASMAPPLPGKAPAALVVCAEGEWHSLPAQSASLALRLAGRRPIVLGPSISASQLVAALYDLGPDFVGVACSMPANLPGARRMIVTARDAGTPVLAGGRGFGRSDVRALALGANAWAGSGEAIPAAVRRLPRLTDPVAPLESEVGPDLRSLEASWGRIVADLAHRLGISHAPEEDLAAGGVWLLRTLAAALLCNEPDLLVEQLRWHDGRARLGAALPVEVVAGAVEAALPSEAGVAQRWLSDATREVGGR